VALKLGLWSVVSFRVRLGLALGWHDYTIGTLDVLQACDACADMGTAYSVIVCSVPIV